MVSGYSSTRIFQSCAWKTSCTELPNSAQLSHLAGKCALYHFLLDGGKTNSTNCIDERVERHSSVYSGKVCLSVIDRIEDKQMFLEPFGLLIYLVRIKEIHRKPRDFFFEAMLYFAALSHRLWYAAIATLATSKPKYHRAPLSRNLFFFFNKAKVQFLQPCFLPSKGWGKKEKKINWCSLKPNSAVQRHGKQTC